MDVVHWARKIAKNISTLPVTIQMTRKRKRTANEISIQAKRQKVTVTMSNGKRSRRTRKRKRRSYRRRHRRYRTPLLLGNRKVVKLIYRDEHQLNFDPSTPSTWSRFWRINGLYDPDFTGTLGTTAFGHDAMKAMFKRYQVIGAKFTVQCAPSQNTASYQARVFIRWSDSASRLSGPQDYFNKQYRNLRMKPVRQDGIITTLSSNYKPTMIENHGSAQDLSSQFGSDPSDTHFVECGALPEFTGTDIFTINFRVTIQYIVLLTEPLMPIT